MAQKLKRTKGSDNVFADLGFPPGEAEITQPRLNALLKSRIDQFSLDALVNIANRAGLNVRLVIRKAA